jgi:hypothetical protein
MEIAPIPAYLVYDGFEQDLDAAMVYERLMDCQHDSCTPIPSILHDWWMACS